jgi:hypothetical protein
MNVFTTLRSSLLRLLIIAFIVVVSAMGVTVADVRAEDPPMSLQDSLKAVKDKIVNVDGGSGLATHTTAAGILTQIIGWLLALVAVLALAALIWGGIQYIISFGNEKQAESGKKTVLYAIIGLIIVGLSFAIIKTVGTFLGVT